MDVDRVEQLLKELTAAYQHGLKSSPSTDTWDIAIEPSRVVEIIQALGHLVGMLRTGDGPKKEKAKGKEREAYERSYESAWERAFHGSGDRHGDWFSSAFEEEMRQRAGGRNPFEDMFRHYGFGDYREQSNQYQSRQQQSTSTKTWWQVLGVTSSATKPQILKAYRALAMRYHPDRSGGSHEKMQELNTARDEALRRF